MGHSSIWLRNAAGLSPQNREEPFANFYFGGFGNNYVDHQTEQRYREYYSLPGAELNEIGGRNFTKSMVEWNLPPLHFSRAGTPGFYLTWMRPAVFASGLWTNLDAPEARRAVRQRWRSARFPVHVPVDDRSHAISGRSRCVRARVRPTPRGDGLSETPSLKASL
jgi:hypothetical protein